MATGTGLFWAWDHAPAKQRRQYILPELVSRPVSKRFGSRIIYRQQKEDPFYGIYKVSG